MTKKEESAPPSFHDDNEYKAFIVYKSDIQNNTHPVCSAYLSMHSMYLDIYKLPAEELFKSTEAYFEFNTKLYEFEEETGNKELTSEQSIDLLKIAYCHFKKQDDAHDFVYMYQEHRKMKKELRHQMYQIPISDVLMKKLNIVEPRIECLKHDLTPLYLYSISWPHLIMKSWLELENHPDVQKYPDEKKPTYLLSLTNTLMTRYLDGLLVLPPKFQQLALIYFLALNANQKIMDAGKTYRKAFPEEAFRYTKCIPLFGIKAILDKFITATNHKYESLFDSIKSLRNNPATYSLKAAVLATAEQLNELKNEYEIRKHYTLAKKEQNAYSTESPYLN